MAHAGSSGTYGGPWRNSKDRYLGLKFKIDGEIHYGWARLTVTADRHGKRVAAKLTGYAYETLADRPIVTGQTDGTYDGDPAELSVRSSSSVQLGLLALGFPSR
jgi:hypothetical protein